MFVPDAGQLTGPDTNWYATITPSAPLSSLESDLSLPLQTDNTYVGNYADTINTSSGFQVILQPNSCTDSNNDLITGNIYLETYLLKTKGDLISMSLPTTSNGSLLVCGGVFYLAMKNNETNLKLAPGKMAYIRYSDSIASSMMKLFNGDGTNIWQYNWLPNYDTSNANNKVQVDNSEYDITTNQLNWISCSFPYSVPLNAQTVVTVSLSANNHLTNANTVAYVVFDNMFSVVNMPGDFNTKRFISSEIPTGKNITIVTISKDGNYYYLGSQSLLTTVPTANFATQDISINPSKVSLSDIKNYLDSL